MTTIWYLILIIALALVAGVMLYTKFAVRHREKQTTSDDSPVNDTVEFAPAVISAPEMEEDPGEDEFSPELVNSDKVETPVDPEEHSVESTLPKLQVDPVIAEDDEENPAVDEYYDDLQEAAAGLAMLMRSSSSVAGESTPRFVVEPEGRESMDAEVETIASEDDSDVELPPVEMAEIPVDFVIQDSPSQELSEEEGVNALEDPSVEPEAFESASTNSVETFEEAPTSEVVEEIPVVVEGEATEEFPITEEPVTRVDLGEEVTGRIEKIDSGLDALEELVASIEASLASFTPLTETSESDAVDEGDLQRAEAISGEAA